MADNIKKTQDKMALIFLIVDGCGSLNEQIDSVYPSKSTGVIGLHLDVQLRSNRQNNIGAVLNTKLLHICSWFFADNFKTKFR